MSIALLGAGRGGILISIARAVRNLVNINAEICVDEIIIVEKNSNCKYSLDYLISSHPDIKAIQEENILGGQGTKINLIFGDCRKVNL